MSCAHYQEENPSTCSRTSKYQGFTSKQFNTFIAVFPKLRDNAQHPALPLVIPEAEAVTEAREAREAGDKWDWMREAGAGGGTRYRLSMYW